MRILFLDVPVVLVLAFPEASTGSSKFDTLRLR